MNLPHFTETNLAIAAERYASNGWLVFPCTGKVPATGHGLKDASCDSGTVKAWWRALPTADIGWCPPPNWIAIDVDKSKGGFETLRELEKSNGPLPFTLRQQTGSGGEHWVYEIPVGTEVRQGTNVLGSGIDTRVGGRGYLLVAPSVHPDTGGRYRWLADVEPAVLPDWLCNLLRVPEAPQSKQYTPPIYIEREMTRRQRYARAALTGLAKEVAETGKGARNDALNKAWFRMAQFRDAITKSEAFSALYEAGIACGLSDREVRAVLR